MENDVLEPRAPAAAAAATTKSAPPASAPITEKRAWCEERVPHVIAEAQTSKEALPDDVRATHLHEVEMNFCVLDPQEYERLTDQELKK